MTEIKLSAFLLLSLGSLGVLIRIVAIGIATELKKSRQSSG